MNLKLASAALAATIAFAGSANAAVIWNNGAVVNGSGVSVLTSPDTTLGAGSQTANNNRVADNFTVTGAGWNVASLDFFSYQTGATSFTFTSATWSIISGTDVNTGAVVASGTTSVTNGGLVGYRVTSTTLTDTSRPIYTLNADVTDFTLAAGNYFLVWSIAGTGASGPWTPPLTGASGSGNAYQSINGAAFALIADGGTGGSYDLPFRINGTAVAAAVPEPATWGMMIAGFGMVGGAMRSRRRTAKVSFA